MRWLKRQIYKLIWATAKLPFRLVYLGLRWIFSGPSGRTKDGYVIKRAKSGQSKYEHRQVAEEILGRRLERDEVVHHINGKRDDNRPANLCVMSRQAHERYHAWYDQVYRTYRKYPRRTTQLRMLKESFKGQLVDDSIDKRSEAA